MAVHGTIPVDFAMLTVRHPATWQLCEHMFVPVFRYTVREHDPVRPWLVIGDAQHLEVELTSAGAFAAWASERWPSESFTAILDPGQQERRLRIDA